MGLYERLIGLEEPKIPSHQFTAAIAENFRGKISAAAVISLFNLSVSEQTEVTTLLARIGTSGSTLRREEVEDVLMLAEINAPGYLTAAQIKTRFGV